jgi:zinc transport system substrate-binding protein
MKNRIGTMIFTAAAAAAVLSACGNSAVSTDRETSGGSDDHRLSVVCTNFPEYDFARQIAGDRADVTMLLKPGTESHTFEPTPEDIINIQNSDLFVYVGGDSDAWVSDVLSSMDRPKRSVFRLMDQVKTVEEETKEGMEAEEGETEDGEAEDGSAGDEAEMDEHVWTSPANAITIMEKMKDELGRLDPANAAIYSGNAETYIERIRNLDEQFREVIDKAERKEIIVADRFPFRYFCDEYGLDYYAAFPGCSTDTQPSAKTVAFLTDKVIRDGIPVIFHIELSNGEMADSVAEATGAKPELLNAVHNVSEEDFRNGATYVSLMQHNVEALQEALN